MMFCPRCGNQINGGLKFCKTCGLPVAQISTYVATGGTAPLSPQPQPAPPAVLPLEQLEYLTPKQQMLLTILLFAFSTPIIAILSEMLGLPGEITALAAILTPIGIGWSVLHYKAQMRRREYLRQQAMALPMQPPQMPPPAYQAALSPPPTNPLGEARRGSVVEDETRKLPEKR